MKTYRIGVKRIEYGWVELKARNKKEAKEKALQESDFYWTDEDEIIIDEIEEI